MLLAVNRRLFIILKAFCMLIAATFKLLLLHMQRWSKSLRRLWSTVEKNTKVFTPILYQGLGRKGRLLRRWYFRNTIRGLTRLSHRRRSFFVTITGFCRLRLSALGSGVEVIWSKSVIDSIYDFDCAVIISGAWTSSVHDFLLKNHYSKTILSKQSSSSVRRCSLWRTGFGKVPRSSFLICMKNSSPVCRCPWPIWGLVRGEPCSRPFW